MSTEDRNRSSGRPNTGKWPQGVRQLDYDSLAFLGIDEEKRLYWDGRPVVVSRGIDLTTWQKVGVIVGIVSAAILATVALAEFIISYL